MNWERHQRLAERLREAEADLAAAKPGSWGHTLAQRLATRRRSALQALYDRDAAEMAAYQATVTRLKREGAIPPRAEE